LKFLERASQSFARVSHIRFPTLQNEQSDNKLRKSLTEIDLNGMTPIDAMVALAKLQKIASTDPRQSAATKQT